MTYTRRDFYAVEAIVDMLSPRGQNGTAVNLGGLKYPCTKQDSGTVLTFRSFLEDLRTDALVSVVQTEVRYSSRDGGKHSFVIGDPTHPLVPNAVLLFVDMMGRDSFLYTAEIALSGARPERGNYSFSRSAQARDGHVDQDVKKMLRQLIVD